MRQGLPSQGEEAEVLLGPLGRNRWFSSRTWVGTWPLTFPSSAPGSPHPVCALVSSSVGWDPHYQRLQMVWAGCAFTRYRAQGTCSVSVHTVCFKTMTARPLALVPLSVGLRVPSPGVWPFGESSNTVPRRSRRTAPEARSPEPTYLPSGFLRRLLSRCFPSGCSLLSRGFMVRPPGRLQIPVPTQPRLAMALACE